MWWTLYIQSAHFSTPLLLLPSSMPHSPKFLQWSPNRSSCWGLCLNRAARVSFLKHKSYYVIPWLKNSCNGSSSHWVKKPKALQGSTRPGLVSPLWPDLSILFHPPPHPPHWLLVPQTSCTCSRLAPWAWCPLGSGLGSALTLAQPTLANLSHTTACILTPPLHSWPLLPCCDFYFFHNTYCLPVCCRNQQFILNMYCLLSLTVVP